MSDLKSVVDDFKNAKRTVKMMGIPQEHIFEMKNVSYKQIDQNMNWLGYRMIVQTKELTNDTGIKGKAGYCGLKGLKWEQIKPFVMKIDGPINVLVIDLDRLDQIKLKELIQY